jgi:hypothetical protein
LANVQDDVLRRQTELLRRENEKIRVITTEKMNHAMILCPQAQGDQDDQDDQDIEVNVPDPPDPDDSTI